jgi:hypothetical protein
MKRSGNVGLVLMGAAAFAATFAGGMAYFGWQKPSHAATVPTAQSCPQRADGTQNCQPERRGYAYYFYPRWMPGWSWGWNSSPEPSSNTRSVALSNNSRSYTPSADGGTVRGGFGSTANRGSYRVSAGG